MPKRDGQKDERKHSATKGTDIYSAWLDPVESQDQKEKKRQFMMKNKDDSLVSEQPQYQTQVT